MTIFITSDLHLAHENIRQYCPETRGRFKDTPHMTEEIIKLWNNTVTPDDEVWILGDVSMGPRENMLGNVSRLQGHKKLILGNHDKSIMKDPALIECFELIDKYKEISVKVDGKKHMVCLFHFPISHWHQCGTGSIMFHGHCHGNATDIPGRIWDVGLDANSFKILVLEDIVRKMAAIPVARSHHDGERVELP